MTWFVNGSSQFLENFFQRFGRPFFPLSALLFPFPCPYEGEYSKWLACHTPGQDSCVTCRPPQRIAMRPLTDCKALIPSVRLRPLPCACQNEHGGVCSTMTTARLLLRAPRMDNDCRLSRNIRTTPACLVPNGERKLAKIARVRKDDIRSPGRCKQSKLAGRPGPPGVVVRNKRGDVHEPWLGSLLGHFRPRHAGQVRRLHW